MSNIIDFPTPPTSGAHLTCECGSAWWQPYAVCLELKDGFWMPTGRAGGLTCIDCGKESTA